MSNDNLDRPTAAEVIEKARGYTGGNLDVIFKEFKIDDRSLQAAGKLASAHDDALGAEIAGDLYLQSKTQRLKVAKSVRT